MSEINTAPFHIVHKKGVADIWYASKDKCWVVDVYVGTQKLSSSRSIKNTRLGAIGLARLYFGRFFNAFDVDNMEERSGRYKK